MASRNTFEPRSRARRRALQALYHFRINPRPMSEIIAEFIEEQDFSNVDTDFFKTVCAGVVEYQAVLNKALESYIDRPVERLDVMETIILQMGAFELMHEPDTPARVVIDECIDLAHRFGADGGHAYINGVLDRAARSLRGTELANGGERPG